MSGANRKRKASVSSNKLSSRRCPVELGRQFLITRRASGDTIYGIII